METSTLENQTRTIPINQIVWDENIRAREHDDADHILRISRSDPSAWPALIVTQRQDGLYALLDGFHRLTAGMDLLGMTEFECDVITPEGDSEYLTSVVLNLGPRALPLSKSDRKNFAIFLHEEYPELSARKIALAVGLSQPTVSALVKQQEEGTNTGKNKARSSINSMLSLMTRIIATGEGAGFMGLGNRAQTIADRIAGSKEPKKILKAVKTWVPVLEKAIELVEQE